MSDQNIQNQTPSGITIIPENHDETSQTPSGITIVPDSDEEANPGAKNESAPAPSTSSSLVDAQRAQASEMAKDIMAPTQAGITTLTQKQYDLAKQTASAIDIYDDTSIRHLDDKLYEGIAELSTKLMDTAHNQADTKSTTLINQIIQTAQSLPVSPKVSTGIMKVFSRQKSNPVDQMKEQYAVAEQSFMTIVKQMEQNATELEHNAKAMQELMKVQSKQAHDVDIFIAAVQQKIFEGQQEAKPLLAKIESGVYTRDDFEKLRQLQSGLRQLSRKLAELDTTRLSVVQSQVYAGILLDANRNILDATLDASRSSVSEWRSGYMQALMREKIQKATVTIKNMRDGTNKMRLENARGLKETVIAVGTEIERTSVDAATFVGSNTLLIEAMDERRRLQNEGERIRIENCSLLASESRKLIDRARQERTEDILSISSNRGRSLELSAPGWSDSDTVKKTAALER